MEETALVASRVSAALGWWRNRDRISQLYLGASAVALVGVLLFMWNPGNSIAGILARTGFALFAFAYLREAYLWTLPKLKLPLVKLAVAASGVMAAAAATGVSRMVVNEATGQDPSQFGTAVALLGSLSFIPILSALVSIGGIVVVPLTMLWTFFRALRTWTKPADLDLLLGGARVFACLVVIGVAASLLKSSSPVFPLMRWFAQHSAHLFDSQPNAACSPTQNDRVLRLNDDLVIVSRMTTDGLQFVRQACALAAESTPLRDPKSVPKHQPPTPQS